VTGLNMPGAIYALQHKFPWLKNNGRTSAADTRVHNISPYKCNEYVKLINLQPTDQDLTGQKTAMFFTQSFQKIII
jgi:hypothetical protein